MTKFDLKRALSIADTESVASYRALRSAARSAVAPCEPQLNSPSTYQLNLTRHKEVAEATLPPHRIRCAGLADACFYNGPMGGAEAQRWKR
jgi:hypothetical protein